MQSGVLHRGIFTHVTPQCVHLGPFDNKVNCSSQVAISHEEDNPAGPSHVLALYPGGLRKSQSLLYVMMGTR